MKRVKILLYPCSGFRERPGDKGVVAMEEGHLIWLAVVRVGLIPCRKLGHNQGPDAQDHHTPRAVPKVGTRGAAYLPLDRHKPVVNTAR